MPGPLGQAAWSCSRSRAQASGISGSKPHLGLELKLEQVWSAGSPGTSHTWAGSVGRVVGSQGEGRGQSLWAALAGGLQLELEQEQGQATLARSCGWSR